MLSIPKYSWKGILTGVAEGTMEPDEAEEIIKEKIQEAYLKGRKDVLREVIERGMMRAYGKEPEGQGPEG